MKDRIRELAEQAGFNISNDPIDGHDFKYEIEKFAELIVRECAMHMDQYADRTGDDLLIHFGVKK
jgi:hypothetical protein